MFFKKKKQDYSLKSLVDALRSFEQHNIAGAYVYKIAKEQFQITKKKYNYLGKEVMEDVFQEAVIDTIENTKKGKLESINNLAAYFSRIFVNKCINIERKNATMKKERGRMLELDSGSLPDIGEEAYDALAKAIEESSKQQKIFDWLESRYAKCFRLFSLRYINHLSFEEIAKAVKLNSAAVVRSSMSQCSKKIQNEKIMESHG